MWKARTRFGASRWRLSRTTLRFAYDRDNFYWDFSLRLTDEQSRLGQGRFLTAFPDLIEGLDTLAAMRGHSEAAV